MRLLSIVGSRIFYFVVSGLNIKYHVNSCDGLRGIAVLFVLLSHLSNTNLHLLPFLNFSGTGKYGVYLFFVLSAFLLTYQLIRKPQQALLSPLLWFKYFARRFLRIFPLYTFVLIINFFFQESPFFSQLTTSALYQHLILQRGDGIFWTIPVEFKYYFLLPVVVLLFSVVLNKKLWVFGIIILSVIALGTFILWKPYDYPINGIILGPYLPIFLLGSSAAIIHYRVEKLSLRHNWHTYLELLALFICCCIFLLIPSVTTFILQKPMESSIFHREYFLMGILWSSFLISYLHGLGLIKKFLEYSLLRLLGRISFSLYLWHMPILLWVNSWALNNGFKAIVVLFVSCLVSYISYVLIEKPIY